MFYELGHLVSDGLPFPALREQAYISAVAREAHDDPEFSARIREGRVGFDL